MDITVKKKFKGLNPFEAAGLPSVTIVTGSKRVG